MPALQGQYIGHTICKSCLYINQRLEIESLTDSAGNYVLVEEYMSKKNVSDTLNVGDTAMFQKNRVRLGLSSRVAGEWKLKTIEGDFKKKFLILVLEPDNTDKIKYFQILTSGNLRPIDADFKPIQGAFDIELKKTN